MEGKKVGDCLAVSGLLGISSSIYPRFISPVSLNVYVCMYVYSHVTRTYAIEAMHVTTVRGGTAY